MCLSINFHEIFSLFYLKSHRFSSKMLLFYHSDLSKCERKGKTWHSTFCNLQMLSRKVLVTNCIYFFVLFQSNGKHLQNRFAHTQIERINQCVLRIIVNVCNTLTRFCFPTVTTQLIDQFIWMRYSHVKFHNVQCCRLAAQKWMWFSSWVA